MPIQNWSPTPASNATQPGINWAEGMPPSDVNNSARQMMADVAAWYASPEWLPQADTPTYASTTSFTVPGNKTAVYSVGRRVQAIGTGYTLTGAIATSVYTTVTTVTVVWDSGSLDNTVSALAVGLLQNQLAALSALMPTGAIIDFGGTAAPSGFLVCDGSAKSRTTYANLFAAIGTTWGAGDGSTTFNVPSLSRRVTVGAGGTGSGTLANTVGATGGEETHALTVAELAAHNHATSETPHVHNNTLTDPQHLHNVYGTGGAGSSSGLSGNTGGGPLGGTQTDRQPTGISITNASATTGITIQNAGSGTAHNNVQPSAVVLKCIKY